MRIDNYKKMNGSKLWIATALLVGTSFLTSCIKDEAKNKECDILNAWVQGDELASCFSDKNQMRKSDISSIEKEITFTVRSLLSLPKQIPVYFDVTPGATVEPASGSMQDFTAGPVTYTVTSEDGEWRRQYKVAFAEPVLPSFMFSFENVEVSDKTATGCSYHIFYEQSAVGQQKAYVWASGNSGASLTMTNSQPADFPTSSVDDGYQGKGVCLKTISTGALGEWMRKPIAAGNLFLGNFIYENVLIDPLKCTQFGIPINRIPVRVTGYYKYKPGEKFTDLDMKEVPGRTDEASVYAVFYRNKDAEGNDYFLYGDDVEDLDNIVENNPNVMKVAQVKQLPAADKWTRFEMFFEGKDVDEQEVINDAYNLVLVFSSSKGGADFEGAIGSTLYIDEVELSFEEERLW